MKRVLLIILAILFNLILLNAQTGNTMSNPIVAGTYSSGFSYSNSQNTNNFTNNYTGKPTNDVFYKFTLNTTMEVTIKHCGSTVNDTYLSLLNSSGTEITHNDDYYGTDQCASTYNSFLKVYLSPGTYYVVSEGYSINGVILTSISGVVQLIGDVKEFPIVAGTYSTDFSYSNSQNTTNFTNAFTGKSTNDVFYKFTLNKKTEVTITHCGSTLSDTYLHLLDESGTVIAYNDDYSGTGQCSSTLNSYLKKDLDVGTYYVVSEGYNSNGVIVTNISGKVYNLKGDSFNDPVIVGTFSGDFNYSDTQNTVNYTNQHTERTPNDIFYKFTLNKKMLVTMTHCGSAIDTYMHLLNSSGSVIASNDDYSGEGACPASASRAFIQKTLEPGTYYVVSEGYSSSGLITTGIIGYSSEEFGYTDIPNSYSSDTDPIGAVGGNFNVSPTGAATLSIPIEVPLGVGGMQPSLSIVYNSQSGNGVVGWGASLSGISAITRAPKDIYHDGTAKAFTYLADDAYYLDGQRLIYSSGTTGQEGAVYYPEADPLTKVTVHGTYTTTTADTWFEIQHSNGMKSYYGNTASGRLSYTSGTSPRINAWYLDYIEDSMGNYMAYTYYNWSYFIYLNTITYGNNKNTATGLTNTVTFNYSYRNDSSPFYIENTKGYMSYRLSSISAKTGSNVYRTYELTYNDTGDGTTSKFSRLTTITVKNSDGEALKPLKLNWNYLPSFYETVSLPTVNTASTYPTMTFEEQQFTSGDFNGDGLTDMLGIAPVKIWTGPNSWTYDTYAYVYYASLDVSGNTQFVSGRNYTLGASFEMGDWKEHRGGTSTIDFDGDGISEFIIPHLSVNSYWKQIGFYVYSNTIQGAFGYNLQRSSEMAVYATGDINKDGKGDIVFIEKGHSNNKYPGEIVGLNSGTALYRAAFNLTLPGTPQKMYLSDFNGNGLEDLMIVYETGYTIFWNQGYGISTSTFSDSYKTTGTNVKSNYWTMMRLGDFNGDGLMDLVFSNTDNSTWTFALNNSNGTFSTSTAATIYAYDQNNTTKDDDKYDSYVMDFDRDGKDDLIIVKTMYSPTLTHTYWMRSTGYSLTQVALATSTKEEDGLSRRFIVGDFNGDGYPDLMNYGYNCYSSTNANVSPSWKIYKGFGMNAGTGKVYSYNDSSGSTTSINYATYANGGIYTKGTGSTYPMADYSIPLSAVKSVTADNGAAGSTTTGYQYSGLKAHLQGKGLLGMSSQTVTNTVLGTVTESGVKTWNTTFFVPASTYSKTTVDGKNSESATTMTVVDKGSKKYFSYPSAKTDKDLDGNTVTTTYKYNATYGYIEEEKADYGNNMYKTIQYGNYILAGGSYKPQLITKTQKHSDDASVYTAKTAFTYDIAKGYKKQAIDNQGDALQLTTDYTYDNVGNVLTSKQSGSGISPITVNNVYNETSQFLTKTYTSPATNVTSYTYDIWGNKLTVKDETLSTNILTTTHTYDKWGKLTSTVYPDGNKKSIKGGWGNNPSKRYFILSQETGSPWSKIWYDNKGREVLTETIGEKGMNIQLKVGYNNKAEVSSKQNISGNLTTTESFTYDARGRVASSNKSSGQSATYSYGNRTESTVTNGRTYTKTFDAWGNIKSAIDPVSSVAYTYYSIGKPKSTVAEGATFSMTYDNVGNQLTLTDPNAGTYTYTYDAAGRVTKQVDGKGIVTTNTYDVLSRLVTSSIDGIATTYTYGTTGYDLLRLTKIQTGNNYSAYTYDKYGRTLSEKRNIDGSGLLDFSYTYNSLGQLSSTLYPGSVQVNNQYDSYGNLSKVLAGTQAIWESTGATGTEFTSQLGSTLTATSTFNSLGLLMNLKTLKENTVLHNMDYVIDGATGNLTSRTGMITQTESFTYDNLDRLTAIKHGTTAVMNMDYKSNGNINSKTGLGLYSYDTRPHAVTSVENTNKLLSTNEQTIAYTAFDKAASISETVGTDNMLLNITYGPDQQRWKTDLKKNNVLQKTIIFAGDYETITEGGVTKQLYYISGGDGLAAIYVKQSGQTDKIYYVIKDHLGSIVKLTDGSGAEVFKASYDAWGVQTITNNTFAFHRGFTGHEHLKEFGLVNMNGRMYDPVLGRFLSPDPYVQMMDFSQNFNRYTYCLNNPLMFNDPSGEFFWIPFAIGFAIGYTAHGLSTDNWGLQAIGTGLMAGFTANALTGGFVGAAWASNYSGTFLGHFAPYVGKMALATAYSQLMPPIVLPVPYLDKVSLSFSPGLGFGTSGLTGGINIGVNYYDKEKDISLSAGIGLGDNHWGWNAAATGDGWGAGYGRTYYSASNIDGQQYGKQTVGTITGYFNHNSFVFSNDVLGDKQDRWRTNAVELNIGRFSIGTHLYTNWGSRDSNNKTNDKAAPVLKNNKNGAWVNGQVHFAPAWVGYRNKNGHTTRVGFSHPMVQNMTQNLIHKYVTPTPYFLNYDNFSSGDYFYTGYHNPHSLWER